MILSLWASKFYLLYHVKSFHQNMKTKENLKLFLTNLTRASMAKVSQNSEKY